MSSLTRKFRHSNRQKGNRKRGIREPVDEKTDTKGTEALVRGPEKKKAAYTNR